jgi:septal ring factor EnvC (AmiA/AmiB activator)
MPDTTLPLDDLTQQIAARESELARLRQEYEARHGRLAELAQHREALQAQLRQIEADIAAVTRGEAPAEAKATTTPPAPAPAMPTTRLKLSDALVEVAREANRPLTARELGEELTKRKFPTTSSNITNLVQTRLTDLVNKGIFQRAEGQPGVVL